MTSINLTYAQAQALVEAFGGEEETIICIETGGGHSGEGIYVGYPACLEEGSDFIGPEVH